MKIDVNADPHLRALFDQRMAAEYGSTAQANFLLDIVGESLIASNKNLSDRNEELVAANTRLAEELRVCRAELQKYQKAEQEQQRRRPKAAA